jgi:hypothetical protein
MPLQSDPCVSVALGCVPFFSLPHLCITFISVALQPILSVSIASFAVQFLGVPSQAFHANPARSIQSVLCQSIAIHIIARSAHSTAFPFLSPAFGLISVSVRVVLRVSIPFHPFHGNQASLFQRSSLSSNHFQF